MLKKTLRSLLALMLAITSINIGSIALSATEISEAGYSKYTNLALGKTAVASSEESDVWTANKIVDGDTISDSSRWGCTAYDNEPYGPEWIYIDLGKTTTVRTLRLVWEKRKPKVYSIQIANGESAPGENSVAWNTVKRFTDHPASKSQKIVLDSAVEARFVRLYVNEFTPQDPDSDGFWGTVSLYEMEVYSEALPDATTNADVNALINVAKMNQSYFTTNSINALNDVVAKCESGYYYPAEAICELDAKLDALEISGTHMAINEYAGASVSSAQNDGEGASKVIDDNPGGRVTIWHSPYTDTPALHPHWVQLELTETTVVKGLAYTPRSNGTNGNIQNYSIMVGTTEDNLTTVADNVVIKSYGSVNNEFKIKPVKAKFIRLVYNQSVSGYASCNELRAIKVNVPTQGIDALNTLINDADGIAQGVYNDATYTTLRNKIDAARSLVSQPDSVDSVDVEEMKVSLVEAMSDLRVGGALINTEANKNSVTIEAVSDECNGQQGAGNEGLGIGTAAATIDYQNQTYWHSDYNNNHNGELHWIAYDLGKNYDLTKVSFLPREDVANGDIFEAKVFVSLDRTFEEDELVDSFTFEHGTTQLHNRREFKNCLFESAKTGRYIKMEVIHSGGASEAAVDQYCTIAEARFYGNENSEISFRVDKSVLSGLLQDANTHLTDNCTDTSLAALRNAITAAQAIYDASEVSQAEVNAQVSALQEAINGLLTLNVQLSNTIITRFGADAIVGTLSIDSSEISDVTYDFADGDGATDNGKFVIDGSTLKVGTTALEDNHKYNVRVVATSGDNSFQKAFTITTDHKCLYIERSDVQIKNGLTAGDKHLAYELNSDPNASKVLTNNEGTWFVEYTIDAYSNNGGIQTLFSISNSATSNDHFQLYVTGNGTIGFEIRHPNSSLHYHLNKGSVLKTYASGATKVKNRIALRADKENGTYSIFVNGSSIVLNSPANGDGLPNFTQGTSQYKYVADIPGVDNIRLGATNRGSNNRQGYAFNGTIHQVQAYGGVLTDEELIKLTVDRSALLDAMNTVNTLRPEQYTQTSYDQLTTEFLNAATVYYTDNANQQQVDDATNALNAKIDALEFITKVHGYTLTLDGKVGVNYYVDMDNITENRDQYSMQFKVGNDTITVPFEESNNRTFNEKVYYRFTCPVAAKQMTDKIIGTVMKGNVPVSRPYEYSVQKYCFNTIDSPNASDNLKQLLKTMMVFGGCAQKNFGYNVNNLAYTQDVLGVLDIDSVTSDQLASYAINRIVEGTTLQLGTTLSLDSDTEIRMYIKGDITGYSFAVNGEPQEPKDSDNLDNGQKMLVISNVAAQDLEKNFTITVKQGENKVYEAQYNALSYAYSTLTNTNPDSGITPELINLVKAMYKYYVAAETYFANK